MDKQQNKSEGSEKRSKKT